MSLETVLNINVAIKYLQRRTILRYLRFMRLLVSSPIVADVTDPTEAEQVVLTLIKSIRNKTDRTRFLYIISKSIIGHSFTYNMHIKVEREYNEQ